MSRWTNAIDPGPGPWRMMETRDVERYGPEGRPLPRMNALKFSTAELRRYHEQGELPVDQREMLTASNYDDPLYLIASVVVENRRPLKQITDALKDITYKLNTGNRNIALLVNQSELLDGTNGLLKDVVVLLQEARDGVETLRESRPFVDLAGAVLAFSQLAF